MGKILLNDVEYGIVVSNISNVDDTKLVKKDSIVTTLDDTVTDEQIPSAKAVYDKLSDLPTDSGSKCYTSLDELGLTADATVEDVVNALKNGESFLAPVNTFTNYETIFPNKLPNDQWNKIHIIKGTSLANSHIRCFSQSGTCEYLANTNNTNIVSWNDVSGTYIDISDSTIEKLGNEILKYPVGKYRINSTTTGNKFTDLPSDAETKCGLIEVNGTAVGKSPFTDTWVYRMYKFECLTGTSSYIRRLNSSATAGQIEVDTGWQKEAQQIYTSLSQLGLTAPVSVGEIFKAMHNKTMAVIACEGKEGNTDGVGVHVSDVPVSYGVLTINKNELGRFSIEYQNSLQGSPCNVKRWIGTLKGSDGTGLYWRQLSAEPTFVVLNDIGLTADATFQDLIDALPKGGSAILDVTEFTNYQTIFPYEEGNDKFGRVYVVKGTDDGGRVFARWFRKDGVKEAIAIFNINDNKFNGWRMLKNQQVYTSLKELGLDTTAKINDILGAMKDSTTFTYKTDVFDYANEYNNVQFGTVSIKKQSGHRIQALMTDKDTGNLYVGKLNSGNQIVGWTKMISEKSDPYTCTSYTPLTGTEDLFTLPCGHYVTEKADTAYNYPITDSSTLTAHIYVLGHFNEPANNKGYRIILYFDNKNRMYRVNEWWGSFNSWQNMQVIGNGGSSTTYSTSEQAIGIWVDGKTIYRKTITKSSHGANEQLISGVDTFIRGYGSCERGGYVYNVPHCGLIAGHLTDEDVTYLNFKLDKSTGALSTIANAVYSISNLKVTLEYTKK